MKIINWIKSLISDRQINFRRNAAVERGEFLYYIVTEFTNVRKRDENGMIIIYNGRDIAELEQEWMEEVIRVSDYNEQYGRFTEK